MSDYLFSAGPERVNRKSADYSASTIETSDQAVTARRYLVEVRQ